MRFKKRALLVIDYVFVGGSVMGLTRWAAMHFDLVKAWLNGPSGITTVGVLSLAYLVFWLRRSVAKDDRRGIVAPRRLSSEKADGMKAALSSLESQRIVLVTYEGTPDTAFFQDLEIGIGNAGWTTYRATHDEARSVTGLRVEVADLSTREEKEAARALVRWLEREGYEIAGPIAVSGPFSVTIVGERVEMALKLIVGTR
jgi:hypothetical protein